jgi:hypothetical protein
MDPKVPRLAEMDFDQTVDGFIEIVVIIWYSGMSEPNAKS